VSVIAAEPVFTRRPTLVPLRAEHADEMAAVLAGPDLYIFTRGEPAHAAGVACTLPTLDRRHNPADHPAPRDRQPSAGPRHRHMTGAAAVRASRRLTLSGAVRCPRSAQSKAT
jgi:hypothetical protein